MKVELLDHMGTDLDIVNAARVSYDKEHIELNQADIKLLNYLATNNHWTPFAHVIAKFRISVPIYVANQLKRHQIGLALNEMSRRYVDTEPEFDWPNEWRGRPAKGQSKQGSNQPLNLHLQHNINTSIQDIEGRIETLYEHLLDLDVAPEQARTILPMSLTTKWIWTGSLMAFIRICKDRLSNNAQSETRDVAIEIAKHLHNLFPYSMDAWNIKRIV